MARELSDDPLERLRRVLHERRRAKRVKRLSFDPWQKVDVPPETGRHAPPAWIYKQPYDIKTLLDLPAPNVLNLVEERMWTDLEFVSDCWLALTDAGRTGTRKKVNGLLAHKGIARIPWLEDARAAVRGLPAYPRGGHHVYAILLGGIRPNRRADYGIYVGETSVAVEQRFMIHLCGTRNSRGRIGSGDVRRRGIELLPSVVQPVALADKSVAKEVEREVAQALRAVGIWVDGGT